MQNHRKVKIVATIGPSSEPYEVLKDLILSGVNVARLNFSHGDYKQHKNVIHNIRKICSETGKNVAILQDLQGPKVRVGKVQNGEVELTSGSKIKLTTRDIVGDSKIIPTDVMSLAQDIKVGDKVLMDDGLIELRVLSTDKVSEIECEVLYGGILKDRKGINVPDTKLSLDCMTEKDLADINFGLEQKVDYIALSFVRSAQDIAKLRDILSKSDQPPKVISKIEMKEAIDNLVDIIKISDAVMVARGDLAVEVGQSLLSGLQKRIIKEANYWKRPVITATQMLDSMVNNPRPTRAEVTDVANALLDGSDAIMLSAETASGKYPVKCIETMDEISRAVESDQLDFYKYSASKKWNFISEAIAESACVTAEKLDATAIICLSTTGKTATFISSFRPKSPIISVTSKSESINNLQLVWGIQTLRIPDYQSGSEAMEHIEKILLDNKMVKKGDKLILTLGLPVAAKSKTNALRVHIVS